MLHTQKIAWFPLPLDCHGCFSSFHVASALRPEFWVRIFDIALDPHCSWKQRLWNEPHEPLKDFEIYDSLPGNLMLLWPLSLNNNGSIWPQGINRGIFQANVLAPCELWPSKASAFSTLACAIALWILAIVYLPDLATKMNDFLLLTWIHLDDASNSNSGHENVFRPGNI